MGEGEVMPVPQHPLPSVEEPWSAGLIVAGRFEVKELLGKGSVGTVYRALDRALDREVALKVIPVGDDAKEAMAGVEELAIQQVRASSHIVRIFDVGLARGPLYSGGFIYLAMELVTGESLRARLRNGPLPIAETVRVAESVLEGLAALHARSLVHQSLTTNNILLSKTNEVKLIDLGSTQLKPQHDLLQAWDSSVYHSEELHFLRQMGGPNLDLYAAGLVLFEMLTGRPPKVGDILDGRESHSAWSVVRRLQVIRREIPPWLGRIVARLLELNPAGRYPTARAALEDLRFHAFAARFQLAALVNVLARIDTGIRATALVAHRFLVLGISRLHSRPSAVRRGPGGRNRGLLHGLNLFVRRRVDHLPAAAAVLIGVVVGALTGFRLGGQGSAAWMAVGFLSALGIAVLLTRTGEAIEVPVPRGGDASPDGEPSVESARAGEVKPQAVQAGNEESVPVGGDRSTSPGRAGGASRLQ
jgi:predicted Ser/Thr protein kinase